MPRWYVKKLSSIGIKDNKRTGARERPCFIMSKRAINQHASSIKEWCNAIKQEENRDEVTSCVNEIKSHIDIITEFLPSLTEECQKDGIYLYVESQYIPEPHNMELINYQKSLEAKFVNKKLVSLEDKDGNNWMNWRNGVKWDQILDTHI